LAASVCRPAASGYNSAALISRNIKVAAMPDHVDQAPQADQTPDQAPMPTSPEQLIAYLDGLGITTTTHTHPPVFTVEEAQALRGTLPGGHCKNLFLKDKKDRLWLVTCLDEQQVDLNRLAKLLGAGRLSFARGELLAEVLGVAPGSVTPLAIVNDTGSRVTAVLDTKLLAHERINCHPLENDATTTLAATDLLRFIRETGHEPVLLDLDRTLDPRPPA
jgi:Ala-tRNA(Pro) deacylase